MSDPFLTLSGTKRKRPSRPEKRRTGQGKPQSRKSAAQSNRRPRDRTPQSEQEDEIGPGGIATDDEILDEDHEDTDESDNDETPAERRLRLAKNYLEKVRLEAGISHSKLF